MNPSAAPIVALSRLISRYRDAGASGYNTRFPMAAPELYWVKMQKDFRRQQYEMARAGKTP